MTSIHIPDHDTFPEVAEEVSARVASCLRGAPALYFQTTDEDSVYDGEQTAPTQKRKGLKSGRLRTMVTMVLKRITWPHEVVYTSADQPAIYEEMSSVHIVNGYVTVMAEIPYIVTISFGIQV